MNSIELNTQNRYATFDELNYLRTLGSVLPSGTTVVMLGAGPGVMLLAVLEGNPNLDVFIVDQDTCEWAEKHLASAGLRAHTRIADSAQTGREWTGARLGLLIVDADHRYEGVKADCEAWLAHVGVPGFVFFHDYDATGTEFADVERYPGVAQAVGELVRPDPAWTEVARAGTAIVFQRGAVEPKKLARKRAVKAK